MIFWWIVVVVFWVHILQNPNFHTTFVFFGVLETLLSRNNCVWCLELFSNVNFGGSLNSQMSTWLPTICLEMLFDITGDSRCSRFWFWINSGCLRYVFVFNLIFSWVLNDWLSQLDDEVWCVNVIDVWCSQCMY